MDALHTDGNGVAGMLSQLLAVDATTVMRRCHSCHSDHPMGEHRAYHGAGVVLRCPSCGDEAMRVGHSDTRMTVEMFGAYSVALPPQSA